jgi:hypothetical protein
MPGRDRTGPLGAGPLTGRGRGYCYASLKQVPEPKTSTAPGYRGACRGWRHRFYATGVPGWIPLTPEQEAADLKTQADWLKTQLDEIQKRIDELTG